MGKVCRLTEAISGTGGGRPKSLIAAIAVAVALIAVTVVSFANVARAADVAGTTVVDPDTTNVWTNYTRPGGQPSTQNVGRIWTDKSVFDGDYSFNNDNDAGLNGKKVEKGDSDFLVSLSALSSTSNLKEMVKTSQPLDIVLVLDTSGSMSGSKMTNLKNAANNFIDATAENNRGLEQDQQTRLAIVRFASGANTERQLNYVTDQNVQQYKNTINRFGADGATYAEEGLQQAQNELDRNGRADVQKIVIFFTDGEPNHSNGFDNEVAAEAVNTAHEMKQGGTIIYAIGVMNGADASVTDDDGFNEYMNGVSSNYPNATADGSNGGIFGWGAHYNTTFGERAEGDYYKAASDPDSIEEIFDEISDEVQQGVGSGSPIEENTQQGNTEPGILTFEDQLGNYMQVTGTDAGKDKIQLAYGDKIYTSTSKTTQGNTDTYHFEGQVEGNEIYGAANLSDLVVTVEHGTDLATGDKVTVTLPASLLPMRHYDVDTDNNTMTVSQAYPVRLFYGVSLKAEAKSALGNPTSAAYAAIVESQASDDGTSIDFYSNSFTKGAADGSTTASFSPNAGNKFYYYTQDATLYVDQNCETEATQRNIGSYNTLYWKDTYWVQTGDGVGEERSTGVAIQRGTAEWNAMESTGGYNGTYYIPAGTPRSDRPATMTDGKDQNNTGTATNVLNPSWTEAGDVTQALGNNGKLSFEKPGSLEIKKNVDWGNASDQTKQDKNTFKFDITANVPTGEGEATEPLSGTYNYYVGASETAAGQVTFTNGSATLDVTGGTTVRIDGLPAGTTFTVTEQGVGQNGWTVTDATSQEDAENANTADGIVTGTIPAGSQASLTFSNTYHANEVGLNTNTTLKVQKNLEGRDWRDTDEFTFEIDGLGNTAGTGVTTPEPADTTITVNSQTPDHTASFGDITFTMPGEYRYSIVEDNDTNPIAGIDYSGAFYRVVVTVTDNGTGSLEVSNVAIEQRTNDDGVENDPVVAVQDGTATFVNKYDADGGTTNIDGTKDYTDNVGGNPINADKFTFKIEALGGYDTDNPQTNPYTYGVDEVPLPAGSDEASHSKTVYNTGYNFTFGTIAFDGGDLGRTYEYKVTELAQNKDGQAEAGMTYDKTEYTVKVTVTEVSDADGTHIVATPDTTPQELKFTNTYDPADATLTGTDAIHGTKTLTGRDMKAGETFYFQLKATNVNAQSVLPNAKTVEVTSLTDGSADFNFGDMSFSKVGEYTFTVNEVSDENGAETGNGSGMTYDSNVCTVTVNVTDNHDGTLRADVTYSNSAHSSVTDKAQFNNTYEATMNYGAEGGGIVVTKTLNDRAEENNTFLFTITGEGEADSKLHNHDRRFTHGPLMPGIPNEMEKLQHLTFDETDAGKTYTFIVDELEDEFGPNDTKETLKGVVFDQSQYRVDIQVLDNGDGTMHTLTTVTKIKNADGSAVSEVVYGPADSDADGYTAPKFGFVNDYNPDPAVVGGSADAKIQVTKTVEGADSATDYTFTLTLVVQDQAQYVEGLTDGKLEVSTNGAIAEGTSQTVAFGELKFTKAGSYGFTVKENQPAKDAGWTFDDTDGDGATDTHYVEIVITDKNAEGKYDGKLYVKSVMSDASEDQPVQITNSYKTDPVVVGGEDAEQQITVQKSVTGDNTAKDAAFNFQLEPVVDDTNTEDVWRANVEPAEAGFEPKTTISGGVTTDASKTATFGGIRFKAAGDYTFKVTEVEGTDGQADPSGWTYDGHEAFVTVHVTDDGEGALEATVSYNNEKATTDADKAVDSAATFTNAYSASSTEADTGSANVQLTKVLEGKAWNGDSFTFQIAADENNPDAPMPKDTEVTVSAPTGKDANNNDQATFDFGSITFDTPGTYVYKVTEVKGDNAGITYSKNVATITIAVTDNHQGALVATVSIANNVFTNTYASELNYAAGGGLEIVKTFENATMREFSFTVTPKNQPSAEKLGIDMAGKTFTTKPGETVGDDNASHAEVAVLDAAAEAKFTQDDVDDTYTYTVKETAGSDKGVTYDDTEYTVTIKTADDGQGGIKVTTTVTDGANYNESYVYDNDDATENQTAVVPFTNTYKATGELGGNGAVSINATKKLTNRPMVDDEFTFNVTNAADDSNTVVATGTNDANGTITFSAIDYSIDQMLDDVDNGLAEPSVVDGKNTFTYTYEVTEDTANLDDGVSAIDAAGFQITVTVTDNGDGTLGIAVAYPGGGDGFTFRNTYGEGQTGQATLNINGTKTLKVESGNKAPSIEGKYTFTLTGSEGAPMPATTEAHNDAAGNVAFGDITFTMENVFGDTGSQDAATNAEGDAAEEAVSTQSATRTKEFTYTVTESGNVPGVDNDAEASKTFTVTVTDNGDGTLSVATDPAQGALFAFTNTYSVEPEESSPTGEGGITITKNLAGRNLNEGEFTFELVDQSGATVATGKNGANGNVELGTVKFTEPGMFTYTIRESKGSLGGVDYDATEYKATAKVTDNGDGTLAVTWSFTTAAGDPTTAIEFNNTYTATPTSVLLGGTKVLDGRALAEGEFTFVLNDADGNELQTVTNNAQGGFCFDQITYDAAGTYEYTISEVKGDAEGVIYDDATIAVKVVVTDNGKGALEVTELTYDGKTELPVFTNTYVKPVEPPKDDSGLMQTGDSTSTFVGVIAGLGALSVAVGLVARKRHGE